MYPSYELLTTLLAAAVQFSGLPAIHVSELPPVVVMSREELSEMVCAKRPGRCISLMAAFDTNSYRILVSNSLDLNDQRDNSFLVHEIVHVLQFKHAGTRKFTSCRAVVSSEHQAYAAQNRYLMANGRVGQEGSTLRYVRCPEEEDAASSDMLSLEKRKPD
jgi:hypothetical protein